MATRKKRTTSKRTNKKVKQTKAEKPSMTDQLREARKRYAVAELERQSTHSADRCPPCAWGDASRHTSLFHDREFHRQQCWHSRGRYSCRCAEYRHGAGIRFDAACMVCRADRNDHSINSGAGCGGRTGKTCEQYLTRNRDAFDLILFRQGGDRGNSLAASRPCR